MRMRKGLAILAIIVTLSLCCFISACNKKTRDPIDDNYRVFYELFVGSFSDSNKDGCGDLRGVINRLDYLNDGDIKSGVSLGVQGIWLSPVFSSPSYHKYDVADYYQIDDKFGTEEDLTQLIDLCHERNIKLILDLPINHTSSTNVWFQRFVNAHKDKDTLSEYYDFYSHCTRANMPGGRSFAPIPGCTNEYYECNFSTDMPELNFDNLKVREEVLKIAKYYLDLGIDGFRFDAIKYVYYSDTPNSVDFWNWYMEQLNAIKKDIYCVGECWSSDSETLKYVSALNCFNFQMSQAEGFIANAAKGGNIAIFTNYVENYLNKLSETNENAIMIPFISNHDMDRSSGYLTLATERMHMAANLYILCSGSPVIYYGEEIGMKGSRGAASTDANRRLSMLWGDGDTVKDPIGTTYDASKQTNGTVAEHLKNEDSLYNYYCKLIALRNKYPQIARGEYKAIFFDNTRLGGFLVTYADSVLGILHNTSENELVIDLAECKNLSLNFTVISDYIGQGSAKLEGSILTIGAQTSAILN